MIERLKGRVARDKAADDMKEQRNVLEQRRSFFFFCRSRKSSQGAFKKADQKIGLIPAERTPTGCDGRRGG